MRVHPLLIAGLLFLLAAVGPPARAGTEHVYESAHLRVTGAVDEAWIEQAAALGEALYTAAARHFGREPEEADLPLELVLYPGRGSYAQALRKVGASGKTLRAGGWTLWTQGVSHIWLQPEPFDTRRLVLHELLHQFHDKCRPRSRRGSGAFWYREGLAAWYGWHRRTKEGLRFGQFDVVALNGLARAAAARARSEAFDPWALATGKAKADYVDALALVGGLMLAKDKDMRARFARFEQEILPRGGDREAFRRRFAERRADLRAAIVTGWGSVLGQWAPTTAGWDERDGVITVRKAPQAAVLTRVGLVPAATFALRVEIVTGTEKTGSAGWVLGLRTGAVLPVLVTLRIEGSLVAISAPSGRKVGRLPPGRKTDVTVRQTATGIEIVTARADARQTLTLPLAGARVTTWGLRAAGTGARFRFLAPAKAASGGTLGGDGSG